MSNTATLTKPTGTVKPLKTNTLNATHRCDRCGAAAFVQVNMNVSERLPEGGHLLFCGHHYNKYEVGLMEFTESVTDERHKLVQNKLVGTENS